MLRGRFVPLAIGLPFFVGEDSFRVSDPDCAGGGGLAHEERKPIGHAETGGVAALPIWIEFMRAYIETRDATNPPDFIAPGNIVFVPVNATSGHVSEEGATGITEAFISGTQPGTAFPH